MKKFWLSGWTKALAFALCLIPLGRLLWRIYVNDLTANPVEFITHFTGDWTLRFLLITLAVTPLRAAAAPAAIDPVPAVAGAVCVFLWLAASDHVDLALERFRR